MHRHPVLAGPGVRDAAAQADDPAAGTGLAGSRSRHRRAWRARLPLTIICAAQAALSLTLVWSNTAFTDEADYLWVGRLVIGNLLHGSSWPAGYARKVLSGSPVLYPPLGAMVDGAGGLAGARILALAFLVGATILLCRTAARLFGRRVAIIATALWALSEPVIRLAFATYDPMSLFLVALSAWLAVEAGWRRSRWLVALSALALALADAVAYSAIVIDPVMVAFAYLAWQPRVGTRRAWIWTASFAGAGVAFFCALITVSQSWAGVAFTVVNRQVDDYQRPVHILADIAAYSGLVMLLAVAGAAIAGRAEGSRRALLLIVLGGTALLVPVTQFYFQTAWALDKHLAYGLWFASMAAGYACLMAGRWLARAMAGRRAAVAYAGLFALVLAAVVNWRLAAVTYRAWPTATSFVTAIKPVVARSQGTIYGSAQKRVAEYYTPQGGQWWRWAVTGMSLDPARVRRSGWGAYYRDRITAERYDVIMLFYAARPGLAEPPRPAELLRLASLKLSEPGVPALTRVLAQDRDYRLVAAGPYDSAAAKGVYAIWQRVPLA